MCDYLYKVIVIGDAGVGKSCLIKRFVESTYSSNNDATIGVELESKIIDVCNKRVKIQLWDTAGQEKFRSITRSYYRNIAGAIICYDVTNEHSFNSLNKWLDEIKKECLTDPKIMLVGTKNDLENKREVSYDQGLNYAKDHNMTFFEVSSKCNIQVNNAFSDLAKNIYVLIEGNNFKIDNYAQSGIQSFMEPEPKLEVQAIKPIRTKKCC